MNEEKQRVTILSKNDLEVSSFCGSGPGGQARNKVASGIQIRHQESGATGRASDSRSQHENKMSAFKRLLQDPRMKFWLAKKVHEVQLGSTLEELVEKDMAPANLKYEVKNEAGQWTEVTEEHFQTAEAIQ